MRTGALIVAVSLALTLPFCAAAQPPNDPVFDLKAILAPPLKARVLKTTEKDGIVTEEVMFHSEMDGSKSVDIFAYFAYPKGAKELPAFIWNQGGLGQATTYWTTFGAKRGYATLCIDFPMPGYRSTGGYPIVSGLELPDDPKKAPIYHGAVALLRAVSYLESRAEVDKNKIGMAGSSWGGFYTTLMVGVDARLKCGSSMFGCGALQDGNLWWDGRGWDKKRDEKFRQHWAKTLDPAWRLKYTKTPIAWFTGTNDQFYWLLSLMGCYHTADGPKHLSLLPNYNHALTPELDEQVFAWLDVHLRGKPAFFRLSWAGNMEENKVTWRFEGPRKAARAELIYSPEMPGSWKSENTSSRPWLVVPAVMKDGVCIAPCPDGASQIVYSATVIDTDGFRYSTPLTLSGGHGATKKQSAWDYDGCAMWGGWEEEHQKFLRLHGQPIPPLSKDAKEGKYAAVLKTGKTTLPPIQFTIGVKHRVACWIKADKIADVVITLHLTADGKSSKVTKGFVAGPKWKEVELEIDPPAALFANAHLVAEVPGADSVLMDAVRCRPILKDTPK